MSRKCFKVWEMKISQLEVPECPSIVQGEARSLGLPAILFFSSRVITTCSTFEKTETFFKPRKITDNDLTRVLDNLRVLKSAGTNIVSQHIEKGMGLKF